MKYGAKYLQYATFKDGTEPAAALPTYGTPASLGGLVKVTDAPTYNTAKAYADNALAEDVSEFKEGTLDAEISELSNANASAIFGATNTTDLEFGGDDTAPFCGVGFYVNKMESNVKKYQGVYYPKVKAIVQGEDFATKGDSITLVSGKLKFTVYNPNYGKWKIKSEDFETEAEAKAWVDAKIVATV